MTRDARQELGAGFGITAPAMGLCRGSEHIVTCFIACKLFPYMSFNS